ncbi:glycosyltransferase [Leucobacter ruminantium]|uniref:Glycosyltransferase n=1 Tax=Leucobacter ruminantium TaxID=1289170 RepID=A0A939LXW3_9MICO|nr:glycosyltransferase [Leucobacter ruminantium]MBO1806487.1 glycosyltransferase [Leucobacter ruminantium]
MRIAVVSRIYRPEPAAASLFLGAVVDALLAEGHEVDVLTATPPPGMRPESRGERVRSRRVLRDASGYVRGYAGYMSFDIPLAFRLLVLPKPHVVLVEPPPTTGAVVRLVCALRRIPYVYDAADIWSDAAQLEDVPGWVIRALRAVERFALRGASHIVTVSEGVVRRVRELGAKRAVTVTGFGADVDEFPVTVGEREPVFVYAGSYSPYHGSDIFIDGFARFLETHPGHRLRFIGNGVERPRLQARAHELGITGSVDYLDPVPPSELVPHLASAAASLASIKPDTVYEYSYASKAFSSLNVGCPVLFTGPGPTIDLLENANEHVRAGEACAYDADAVAAAMARLVDEPASSDEREALGRWAAEHHSLQAVARYVADVVIATGGR